MLAVNGTKEIPSPHNLSQLSANLTGYFFLLKTLRSECHNPGKSRQFTHMESRRSCVWSCIGSKLQRWLQCAKVWVIITPLIKFKCALQMLFTCADYCTYTCVKGTRRYKVRMVTSTANLSQWGISGSWKF